MLTGAVPDAVLRHLPRLSAFAFGVPLGQIVPSLAQLSVRQGSRSRAGGSCSEGTRLSKIIGISRHFVTQ